MEVQYPEDRRPGDLLDLCCVVIATAYQDCSLYFAICTSNQHVKATETSSALGIGNQAVVRAWLYNDMLNSPASRTAILWKYLTEQLCLMQNCWACLCTVKLTEQQQHAYDEQLDNTVGTLCNACKVGCRCDYSNWWQQTRVITNTMASNHLVGYDSTYMYQNVTPRPDWSTKQRQADIKPAN